MAKTNQYLRGGYSRSSPTPPPGRMGGTTRRRGLVEDLVAPRQLQCNVGTDKVVARVQARRQQGPGERRSCPNPQRVCVLVTKSCVRSPRLPAFRQSLLGLKHITLHNENSDPSWDPYCPRENRSKGAALPRDKIALATDALNRVHYGPGLVRCRPPTFRPPPPPLRALGAKHSGWPLSTKKRTISSARSLSSLSATVSIASAPGPCLGAQPRPKPFAAKAAETEHLTSNPPSFPPSPPNQEIETELFIQDYGWMTGWRSEPPSIHIDSLEVEGAREKYKLRFQPSGGAASTHPGSGRVGGAVSLA